MKMATPESSPSSMRLKTLLAKAKCGSTLVFLSMKNSAVTNKKQVGWICILRKHNDVSQLDRLLFQGVFGTGNWSLATSVRRKKHFPQQAMYLPTKERLLPENVFCMIICVHEHL